MDVVVYSKNNCPNCVIVKNKLTQRGIDFEEINIDTDATLRAWLIGQGHRQVPVVYVNGVHTPPDAIVAQDFIEQ